MASRKAKPRAKRTSNRDVQAAASESSRAAITELPSGAMTVEVHALNYAQMVSPPAPPTTARVLDDLAATVEMPALGSMGPRVLVMDAAEAVIADRGFGQTTVKETAEWAGISVDVFHAHFNDERALLGALAERFNAQVMTAADDALKTSTPVQTSIKSIVDLVLGRAALVRAVLGSGDRVLIDDFRRVGTHLTVRLTRALEGYEPADVSFAVLSAVALAHHAVVVGPDWSGLELDREELSERAADAAMAYLASRSR